MASRLLSLFTETNFLAALGLDIELPLTTGPQIASLVPILRALLTGTFVDLGLLDFLDQAANALVALRRDGHLGGGPLLQLLLALAHERTLRLFFLYRLLGLSCRLWLHGDDTKCLAIDEKAR